MMNRRQPRYSKGQRIGGRFLVHQALMGGMGEVYLCLDEQQMLPLALKTFQGSSPDLELVFRGEVDKWIALEKHPNIVRCFWMEKFDNIPFMVLEWVVGDESRGSDLRSWLRRGPLDLPLALRFTIDIVRGLIHANEKSPGIVHRDLKPDNVLVNQSRQAKITDFGLATVAQVAQLNAEGIDESDMGQSRYVGGIVGTPAYMPPEQWRGDGEIDFRADVYAVGCILYELITGKWLYDARTISELRAQHLEAPVPALTAEPTPILDGCLAKRRENRYAQLDLLLADLTRLYEAHSDEPLPEVSAEAFTAVDYNNRGMTFANLGQPERAIQDYDAAIRLDPNLATVYYNRGNNYEDLGEHERAIADYDAAVRLDPNLATAYYNRGLSYGALGQHERAIADYDVAVQLDPNDAEVYYNRGHRYGALGQPERAIQDYDAAIRLDPNDAAAYYNRGLSHGALGQHERAIADYDAAIRLDPNYAAAYNNRGTLYGALGQHERAIADYDAAIRLDPNYAAAYLNRGTSYRALGQHERAIADYDATIRLDPNHAAAYLNRGTSYQALRQYERAIDNYNLAIELDPSFAPAYLNKGVILVKMNRLEQAIQWGEKAAQIGAPRALEFVNLVRQMLAQGSAQSQQSEQEKIVQQLVSIYRQYGEAGLRQVLAQQGVLAAQVEQIVVTIKQALGE